MTKEDIIYAVVFGIIAIVGIIRVICLKKEVDKSKKELEEAWGKLRESLEGLQLKIKERNEILNKYK